MSFEEIRTKINEAENFLVRQVARTAPWLAPFPTAYVVYRSTMEHLDWPDPVAIAAGLVIEGLGLSTAFLAVTFRAYNQTKWKKHPKAPTLLATVLVAVYLTVVIVLTVVLDLEAGESGWAVFAVGIFPFLSLCGMTVVALQNDHEQRIAAAAKDKAKRSEPVQKTESLRKVVTGDANHCWCGQEVASPKAWGPHGKKHANDVRKILADTGATLQTVATKLEALYGLQPPKAELQRLYNKYRTDF